MKLLLVRNGALVLNLVLEFLHVCIQASSCVSSTCCSQHSITTTTTGHQHHLQYVASPVPHPARPPPVAAPPTPPAVQHCHPGCTGSHNAAHLRYPPAVLMAQTSALALYDIHHHYHHHIRMCLCRTATHQPMVRK